MPVNVVTPTLSLVIKSTDAITTAEQLKKVIDEAIDRQVTKPLQPPVHTIHISANMPDPNQNKR